MQRLVLVAWPLAFLACSSQSPAPATNPTDAGPAAASGSAAQAAAPAAGASGEAGQEAAPQAGGNAGMIAGAAPEAGSSAAGSSGRAGAAGSGGGAANGGGMAIAGAGGTTPSTCPGVFCEDFESGQLDAKVWTRTMLSSGNTAMVQTNQVAHGTHAVQLHAKGGSRYSVILHEGLPESLQKHYFGRLYFYATGFPTESGGHTAYITSSDGLTGFPDADHHLEVASYTESSGPTWQLTYWTGDGPEYIGTGGKIPAGKWFCLEWELNDAPDEIAVWVDGNAMQGAAFRNINNHQTNLLGKMTALGLGFRTWHPMGAPDIDIYMDDVVLDTKRVGCL